MQQLESFMNGMRDAFEIAKEEIAVLKNQNELMRTKIDQLMVQLNAPSVSSSSVTQNSNAPKTDQISVDSYVFTGPTGECSVQKEHDISIIYFVDSGSSCVAALSHELKQRQVIVNLIEIYDSSIPLSLEQTVANSHLLVVVLSRDALKERGLVFGMECAGMYPSVQVVLLHDPATCTFPGYLEQPETVRGFFSEKAITYLEDYLSSIAQDIVSKLNEHKDKAAKRAASRQNVVPEDIRTRLFLSHKRLTAQAIAGRLYEGLKKHYHIFLDSEAHFKIHDLEAIVNNTKVLLFILSSGILESVWCIKELRAAIKAGKKVIVVRDYSYKLPDHFPVDLLDIEHVLRSAPTVTWMAEYNNLCVEKLIAEFIGPDDEFITEMEKWLSDPLHENVRRLVVEHDYTNTHLDLTGWKKSVKDFVRGAVLYFDCSGSAIESITASYNSSVDEECLICLVKKLPNLKHLNIQGCRLSDKALKVISETKLEGLVLDKTLSTLNRSDLLADIANLPLKSLSLQSCPILTAAFLQKLADRRLLQKIDLSLCPQVDDNAVTVLSEFLADSLQEISVFMDDKITNKGLQALARCRSLTAVNIRGCNLITDDGLGALLEGAQNLQYLDIRGLPLITSAPLNSICSELLELHAENTAINDTALAHIGSRCTKLISIQLDHCKAISNSGIEALSSCHNLQSVGLTGTKVTNEGVTHLVRGCPNLRYLHTESCAVNHQQLAPVVQDYCKHVRYAPYSVPEWKNDPKYKNSLSGPHFDEHGLVFWLKAEDVANYVSIDEPVPHWDDAWSSGLVFQHVPDKLGAKVIEKPKLSILPADLNNAPNTYGLKFSGTCNLVAEQVPVNLIHNDFTIFLVKKNVKPSNANCMLFTIGNPADCDQLHLYEGTNPHTTKFIVKASGQWTADYLNLPVTFPIGDLHVIIYQRKGTMMRLWQHANAVQEKNGTPGPLVTRPLLNYTIGDTQIFGASIDSILNPTYISEMLIFNQALSDDRLAQMKLYLQQKYQFKVSLVNK